MIENNIVQNLAALKALPSSWSIQPFEEVVKDISGGNKKTLKSDFLERGDFVIVDQGQNLIAGYTNNKELLVKASPPYVVFGDHTRAFKFIDVRFAMGADGTKVLKPKIENILIEKYLYYFFLTLNIPNTGYNRHFKYLKELKIPLPPFAEQQKIAAILDAADSLRQKDQQLVERYTALSQSLFLEMFGDPVTNPIGWKISNLNGVTVKITDGEHQNPPIAESGDYLIMAKDVLEDRVSFAEPRFVSHDNYIKYTKKCNPEIGDVLIVSRGATVGRCTVVKSDLKFCLMGSVILIKPNELIIGCYLNQLLKNTNFSKKLINVSSASAQQAIYISHLKQLNIPVPSIKLQKKFAERIQLIEAQKQQAQRSLEKSEALFNSLLQRAFTGELTAKMAA